ncbi:SDR family oxidoreductase [Algoriphagus halophytocola]|uniref:SDR family oxidoreductase n=1 Tax=Algoriphagus halophytocola TaxID=2991499 RepID=A0ABY6MKB9_9BACT|nr:MULTISPECIES: SDR family oxidoreductase [unclassified Algoriphagus]UZD24093.1 SDR family oxidoreductase [Algoriphagus sp. TR-M5]WBL41464.1 SDR family oxidoreductase [Algoriphagus sp. TR-M9]
MKQETLKDKVVIITGATSGIGEACAKVFGKTGAIVVITGRNPEKLKFTSEQLLKQGVKVTPIHADASSEADTKRMVELTLEKHGRIDILINNAGITMRALFQDLDLEVFKKVMDTNFWGTVYATKHALPEILKTKGTIIGISSINGFRGTPARTAYTASKFAINGFFDALRTEVMNQGVHVLVASPGFTASNIRNSALTANGSTQGQSPRDESKMMTSEEVAKEILNATLKHKRDLILTTQGKMAVFVNKWFPGLMDTIVYNQMAKEKDSPFH